MIRFEVFMKGFLVGFCCCSILLFCMNIHIYCRPMFVQSNEPAVPDYGDFQDTQAMSDVTQEDSKHIISSTEHSKLSPKSFTTGITVSNDLNDTKNSNNTPSTPRRGPRILCWVMTTNSSLMTKAVHVHDTWGKRCDKILFFISSGKEPVTESVKKSVKEGGVTESVRKLMKQEDNIEKINNTVNGETHKNKTRSKRKTERINPSYNYSSSNRTLPVVTLDSVPEGRGHLTAKTMNAFNYIYHMYLDKYDWFLKADDDTYVVMENLRHFLSHQDKSVPVYFGHHFNRLYVANGYNSGGSGYVLSQAALRKFGVRYKLAKECKKDGEDEDVDIGRCMEHIGVAVGNTADQTGAMRFVCFSMEEHFMIGLPKWTREVDAYGAKTGIESISPDVISFHYVQPWMMYALEYFVYHFKRRAEDEIADK